MTFRLALMTLAFTIQPALADELGRITAFIDGKEQSWHTITMTQGDQQVATASFEQTSHYADLYVQGHPEPRFVSKGMLSVDVRYAGQFTPDDDPMAIEIMYLPNGMGGQFFTSRGAGELARFQIVAFDGWGTAAELVAAFSGKLCSTRMNAPVDLTDCMRINGQITSRIAVE